MRNKEPATPSTTCAHCFACTVRRLFPTVADLVSFDPARLSTLFPHRYNDVHEAITAAIRHLPIDYARLGEEEGGTLVRAYQALTGLVVLGAGLERCRVVSWPDERTPPAPAA